MDMSMSTNYSSDIPNFLTYILDNLLSFCHKEWIVGMEHRARGRENPSWQPAAGSQ